MDKAAILAQVINHVKELKSKAVEISKGYNIPSDTDEVRVEAEANAVNSGSFYIRATLCCEDCPELFAELRQTLDTLQLKLIRAEISTLSGRVKNILIMRCDDNANDIDRHIYTASVHQALKSVLDRVNSTVDFYPRAKRRRISMFESSCSSS